MNGFRRGTGCYGCEICGRLTRDTGEVSFGTKLCVQCWEVAGIENEILDGHTDEETGNQAIAKLEAAATGKGGFAGKFAANRVAPLATEWDERLTR